MNESDDERHFTVAASTTRLEVYTLGGTLAAIVTLPPASRPTVALSAITGVPANEASRPVQLADTYAYPDSNYSDMAPWVQAELNKGPRVINWDKGVTMSSVRLSSGHAIQATAKANGAIVRRIPTPGVKQPNGYEFTCAPMWLNKNPTYNPAGIVDKNIRLSGGTWNGKGPDQITDYTTGFLGLIRFIGVDGLILEDLELVNARSFAGHFLNTKNVIVRRCLFRGNPNLLNTDGPHFNSGLDTALFEDNESIDLVDDSIATNGSTNDPLTQYFPGPPVAAYVGMQNAAAFRNITIRGWRFTNTRWGHRVLVGLGRHENYRCSNYVGITRDYLVIIDDFQLWNSNQPRPARGLAYAKNLRWDNLNTTVVDDAADTKLHRRGCIIIATNTDYIAFTTYQRSNYTANWCTFRVQGGTHTTLTYDKYQAADSTSSFTAPHLQVDEVYDGNTHDRAGVQLLSLRNAVHQRAAAAAVDSTLVQVNKAEIALLDLTGTSCQNLQYMVQVLDGTVGTIDLSGTTHTGGTKRIYVASAGHVGTIRFVGYTGTLASLVYGPGTANVTNLVTR